MHGCNFTDVNGARMPILAKQLGNDQGNKNETVEVENRDLACWSAGAKPALVNQLLFGGSAFRHVVSIIMCELRVVHLAISGGQRARERLFAICCQHQLGKGLICGER
jgi:hypothetical protein